MEQKSIVKVDATTDLEKSREWWFPIRELFTVPDQSLAEYLDELEVPAEVGHVTTLRRLDVILWMEQKLVATKQVRLPWTFCSCP